MMLASLFHYLYLYLAYPYLYFSLYPNPDLYPSPYPNLKPNPYPNLYPNPYPSPCTTVIPLLHPCFHGCRKCELGEPSSVHIENFSCTLVFTYCKNCVWSPKKLKISGGLCPSPQI